MTEARAQSFSEERLDYLIEKPFDICLISCSPINPPHTIHLFISFAQSSHPTTCPHGSMYVSAERSKHIGQDAKPDLISRRTAEHIIQTVRPIELGHAQYVHIQVRLISWWPATDARASSPASLLCPQQKQAGLRG